MSLDIVRVEFASKWLPSAAGTYVQKPVVFVVLRFDRSVSQLDNRSSGCLECGSSVILESSLSILGLLQFFFALSFCCLRHINFMLSSSPLISSIRMRAGERLLAKD